MIGADARGVSEQPYGTEAVAHAIREHEVGVHGWAFRDTAARFNELFDRLNEQFLDTRLPKAVISLGPDLVVRYGTYRIGRDELGVQHRIHLNSRHFGRSEARVAVTLLHEMLHAFQHLYGKPGRRPRYHNAEFVDLCARTGFMIQRGSGVTLSVSGSLIETLARFGFSDERLLDAEADDAPIVRPRRTRMLRCDCDAAIWVDPEHPVAVACLTCGELFRPAIQTGCTAQAA